MSALASQLESSEKFLRWRLAKVMAVYAAIYSRHPVWSNARREWLAARVACIREGGRA